MFVLNSKATEFKYDVRVKQARESGKLEVFEFTGIFKRLEQPQIAELLTTMPRDRSLLDKVWVGWSGVKHLVKEGEVEVQRDLVVSAENREVLLREPGVEAALINAWLDAVVFGPAKN